MQIDTVHFSRFVIIFLFLRNQITHKLSSKIYIEVSLCFSELLLMFPPSVGK